MERILNLPLQVTAAVTAVFQLMRKANDYCWVLRIVKTRYNHKMTDASSEGQIQANHFSSFYAIQASSTVQW
jgi:ABC-type glycerol-3-phosphate transport system permease component